MRFIFSLLILIAIYSSSFAQTNLEKYIVNAAGGLWLKEYPDEQSKRIKLIPSNNVVDAVYSNPVKVIVDGKEGSWNKVRIGNLEGFMFSYYLNPVGRVSANGGLFLKEEPNNESERVYLIPNNSEVIVLDSTKLDFYGIQAKDKTLGSWIKIRTTTPPELEGYVFDKYISQSKTLSDSIFYCAFNNSFFESIPLSSSFRNLREAQGVIDDILSVAQIPQNFELQSNYLISNAAAIIFYNPRAAGFKRLIQYNPRFIQSIIRTSGSYYSSIGVMAHEIGHQYYNHGISDLSPHARELQADRYAGEILKKMGATWDEAKSMFTNPLMYTKYDSRSHPNSEKRIRALFEGFNSALSSVGKKETTYSEVEENKTDMGSRFMLVPNYYFAQKIINIDYERMEYHFHVDLDAQGKLKDKYSWDLNVEILNSKFETVGIKNENGHEILYRSFQGELKSDSQIDFNLKMDVPFKDRLLKRNRKNFAYARFVVSITNEHTGTSYFGSPVLVKFRL